MSDVIYTPGRSASDAMAAYGLSQAVKLSSNEMPWGPLPTVRDAITRFLDGPGGVNRYPDMRATELKAVIAAHHGLPVECVAVGTGSGGVLNQLTYASTGPGDEVLMPWPTFGEYALFAGWTGATAVRVPLVGSTPAGPGLAAAITPRTRMVVIASPNNPTGTVLRIDGLQAVLETAAPTCLVVLDQAYQDFVTASHSLDAASLVAAHPNLVVLRTFSKAHGLAGLRVGYLLAQPEIIRATERLAVPFNLDGVAQVAAVASLQAFAEVQERVNTIVAERERVVAEVRRRGFGLANTQANFVWLPAGAAANDLAGALERTGIVTRCFAEHGVRVTIGMPEENERFLDAFGKGELVDGLTEHWGLPTGPNAMRVHDLVQQLLDPDLQAGVHLAAGKDVLARCESIAWGSSTDHALLVDVRQVLDAIADLVADSPAETLPLLEGALSGLHGGT